MNPHKIGKGQIGLTGKDDYFSMGQCKEAQLMPDFTSEQLNKLPPVIRAIADMPSYRAITEKRKIADAIKRETSSWQDKKLKYDSLDPTQRISKQELIDVKTDIIEVMKIHGALEIIPKEAQIDLIALRLDNGKAVFMVSGEQINLKKMGMEHLSGKPGFVQELLRGHPDTEAVFNNIMEKQKEIIDWASTAGIAIDKVPVDRLPTVAVVGGGASARGNTLDLLERVDPKLLNLISIRPLPKIKTFNSTPALEAVKKKMDYHSQSGYIQSLNKSEDGTSIKSLKAFNAETQTFEEITTDLLVHTGDEQFRPNQQARIYKEKNDNLTEILQKHPASNALTRNRVIIPGGEDLDIQLRITEPFKFSLREDENLVDAIRNLVKKQNTGQTPTLVLTGNNFFTKSVTLLAAELGYKGKFIQLAAPSFPEERSQHDRLEEKLQGVRSWRDISGRMVADSTKHENDNFIVGVKDSSGKILTIDKVDIVINATGKTQSIPLIEAMKEKGYIGTHLSFLGETLHTKNSKLEGWNQFFLPDFGEFDEVESPTIKLKPHSGYTRIIEPWGWEEAYKFGRSIQKDDLASE